MFDHLEDLNAFANSTKALRIRETVSIVNGGESTDVDCRKCHGRGHVQLGYHNRAFSCFSCKGKGKVSARSAAASQGRETAERNKQEKEATFREANKDVMDYLHHSRDWSTFSRSMLDSIRDYGSLTERQLAAVRAGIAKSAAKRAENQKARTSEVDLAPIFTMFDKAREAGLKKLAYRAEGLVIFPAKAGSVNAGSLYVKTTDGEYLGKVAGKSFIATREATPAHKAALATIAVNPSEAAKAYGKLTGACSCCGRELTDPVSVSRGIGPICADKWGL